MPEAPPELTEQVARAVQRLRGIDVQKPPGVAEAIDWVHAAHAARHPRARRRGRRPTLGSVLKYREDQDVARAEGLAWVAGA